MPGVNCSVFGCSMCRRTKGIGIFRIPAEHVQKEWRQRWLSEITKTRVVDENFKKQIANNNVYACEKHFHKEFVSILSILL